MLRDIDWQTNCPLFLLLFVFAYKLATLKYPKIKMLLESYRRDLEVMTWTHVFFKIQKYYAGTIVVISSVDLLIRFFAINDSF